MGPEGLCKHPVGSLSFNWRYLLNEILVRLALGGFAIGFNQIKPFEREVYAVEWYNHYYPYVKEEVFPESIAAIIFASCLFVVPVTVLALFIVWKQLPRVLVVEEAVNFFLGVSFALESDFVINELVKNTYGRPRPDYLSRCFGNDKNKWPEQNITLIPPIPRCTNPDISYRTLLDGRRSFPSAHTSLSFTVYGYLALFLYRKLCQIKNTGSLRLFLPTLILSFALYIGITRTQGNSSCPNLHLQYLTLLFRLSTLPY